LTFNNSPAAIANPAQGLAGLSTQISPDRKRIQTRMNLGERVKDQSNTSMLIGTIFLHGHCFSTIKTVVCE